jgi:hypothetical protein
MPVVIGARYNPYSFDDMLKPLAMAQQEYNTVQEGLASLTDSSNQFSRYLEGTEAGARVKQYNAAIESAVTDMAKHGLRRTNRDTLLALKRQYNNDIAKINQSAAQLDTLYKGVQAAQLKAQSNGDRLFVANMPNVDQLLADPTATPIMISANGLQQQGTLAAKALVAQSDSNVQIKALSKMYDDIVTTKGVNSEEAQRFLQDVSTIPALAQTIDQIESTYNVGSLGSQQGAARQAIIRGMFNGLSQEVKHTPQQNPEYQVDLAYRKAYAEAAGKAAGKGEGVGTGSTINGIYSQNFVTPNGNSMAQVQAGIDSLAGRNGGLSAQVFGKTWGRVNPMKAYEEYRAGVDRNTESAARTMVGADGQIYDKNFWNKATPETMLETVKKKYGVERLLTPQEYNALKDLGYTSDNFFQKAGSLQNFQSSIQTQINDLAHSTAIYNINGGESNKRMTERILQNADLFGENNSDATLVQEFEKGKKKGNVSPKKLRDDMEKGAQFTLGINKDQGLILTSSIGGKQYAIAPELISEESRRMLAALPSRIASAKQLQAQYLGRQLTKQEEQQLESQAYQLAIKDIASSVGVDITQALPQTSSSAE